jgi:hypothetical protein
MISLATCDSPFSLDDLAARIRNSSNFSFSWQFYQYNGIKPQSVASIRQALEAIIAVPGLHKFLRESFEPAYAQTFEIKPLHEHCRIEAVAGQFENILAQAAGDHLGAYSQVLRGATVAERQEIKELFASAGEFLAFELLPGNVPGCPVCRDLDNHLFSSWFFHVAWDWCLLAVWPHRNLLWVGCLTDTD